MPGGRWCRSGRNQPVQIEVLLTEPMGADIWQALVRPGRKVGVGERLAFPRCGGQDSARGRGAGAGRVWRAAAAVCASRGTFLRRSSASGTCRCRRIFTATTRMPTGSATRRCLPGTVGRWPRRRRGLHFTPQVLAEIAGRGVEIARVTLHVGLGTFAPLRVERVDEVKLHRERYTLSAEATEALNRARVEGRADCRRGEPRL